MTLRYLSAGLFFAGLPAMAQAGGATPIPEASSTLLLALGALGVLVGRRVSARRSGQRQRPPRAPRRDD